MALGSDVLARGLMTRRAEHAALLIPTIDDVLDAGFDPEMNAATACSVHKLEQIVIDRRGRNAIADGPLDSEIRLDQAFANLAKAFA